MRDPLGCRTRRVLAPMLPFSDTPESDIRTFVRHWMKLLAQGRLEEACSLLDEPNSYGNSWTPQRITGVVQDTFAEGTRFRNDHPEGPVFTDPDELLGGPDRDVGALSNDLGYWYDCDVPLNHKRSDLTAQFEFLRRPDGLAVILHDLHVL